MNYNPYFYGVPTTVAPKGLFSTLFGGINLQSFIANTSKTLNVINQTIPIIKQAKPILNNARTMFKVMNEFKKVETPTINNVEKQVEIKKTDFVDNKPVFFM